MTHPRLQFGRRANCEVSRERDTREHPGLRAWLCRYRRHRACTFHELDLATGHWQRL